MRLAESGSVVVGIDKSPEQTDSAQKRYTRNNLHFAVGDALDVSTVRKICAAHEIGPVLEMHTGPTTCVWPSEGANWRGHSVHHNYGGAPLPHRCPYEMSFVLVLC